MTRPSALSFTLPLAAILLMLASVPASAVGEPAAGKAVRFLTGPQAGDAGDIALAYIQEHLEELGLTAFDLEGMVVRDRYVTRHNGITHLHYQQVLDGIEVYNGVMNVNVARDGSIINIGTSFVGNLAAKAAPGGPTLSDRDAIERAAAHFGLAPGELVLLGFDGGSDLRARFSDPRLSRDDIPVHLTYQPVEGGVRLAWQTVLSLVNNTDWWSIRVDAATGEVLSQYNFTNRDSYKVIPFPPFSDPEDSGGQLVIDDPADLAASPFAWHDTDGVAGGDFTDTRGNNVFAQEDFDGNNSGGFRPDGDLGGAMLEFDFDFDPAEPPTGGTNLEAAITNLFYANNVMHDLTYRYGFDEPAGNFQVNNYGNGGAGNDQVNADAQDNSQGTPPNCNNATFGTNADGIPGRMSMFVWTGVPNATLTVNSPAGIAGDYSAAKGCWGGGLVPPTTADIELVDDGTALPNEGCNALVGFTAGNVALIDRGTCEFGAKALNAQNAGASAAIIANDLQQGANGIIAMGVGVMGGGVTIPAVMIGNADGNTIKGVLPAAVNATVKEDPANQDRDSDLDNGIIAHEYGHGISNRLTGGPATASCLSGNEQAGEGWSDFWTLMLTAKSSDTPELNKGVGNYVSFLPVNGPGIRNFPYTTDLAVNPQTYAGIATTNVPHGVGEIWMDMVWEMYWELVIKHGFDCDFYTGTGGNNLTIQLVVDGMKLQNCNPTFLDARDAILAADLANNGGANECEIWRAFAKRGAGLSAVAGTTNVGDETEAFDIPATCPAVAPSLFTDGFECGDTARWSATVQ